MKDTLNPTPQIQEWLSLADEEFMRWSQPRVWSYECDRGFYTYPEIRNSLPILEEISCEAWIKLKLNKKRSLTLLDIGCGTGRAAKEIQDGNPGVRSFGITGNTFFYPQSFDIAMQLDKNRLILGNAARIKELIESKSSQKKFDLIYSYQGITCIPMPFLYQIEQIYKLLEEDGVCFLDLRTLFKYLKVKGFTLLEQWLKEKGYAFEFPQSYTWKEVTTVPMCSFRKTHEAIEFPVTYARDGSCTFNG